MKPATDGLLRKLRLKCFGGCLGGQGEQLPDPDLIDMSYNDEEFLHLDDFTASDANLSPMLPEEVEFRRIETFHCRNLTIVDTSPIAVRKLIDLTKELGMVKEPIVIELPEQMPFDLNDSHPFMESQAPPVSESDMR